MEKIELKLTTANLKKRQLTKSRQYLSEVNIEQLCFNMKTARYNRVEMKRIIQQTSRFTSYPAKIYDTNIKTDDSNRDQGELL